MKKNKIVYVTELLVFSVAIITLGVVGYLREGKNK